MGVASPGPGGPRDGLTIVRDERLVAGRERLEARDEVTPGERGDSCSGMAVVGTQGWADMSQKGDWHHGMEVIGTQGWTWLILSLVAAIPQLYGICGTWGRASLIPRGRLLRFENPTKPNQNSCFNTSQENKM